MNKREFVKSRKPTWKRFEYLVERLSGGAIKRLPAQEIADYSQLFREVSNDLATIRSRGWGQDLESYLNHLAARGHNTYYSAPPARFSRVIHFLTSGFPQVFRANIWYFWTAFVLFFGSLGVTWAVVQNNPPLVGKVLAPDTQEMYEKMYSHDPDRKDTGFGGGNVFMQGFYIKNNTSIAIECFARGLLLGVGTVYTLLYNGIAIGATAGYLISLGLSQQFIGFVITHGSFELTAIAVSGGAGLMLSNAIIHPGQRTRVEALRVRGMEAIQVMFGAAIMMVIAAVFEAYWSPAPISVVFKYVVGTLMWALVITYLALAGRDHHTRNLQSELGEIDAA